MGLNLIKSAIYEGTLEEDFITTAKETKGPYCKAKTIFTPPGKDYPYTIVPAQFMIFPLKKGDKILVKYFMENLQYPILHSVNSEFPSSVLDSYSPPTPGSLVSPPSLSTTFSFSYINANQYTLFQDDCSISHNQDTVVFQTKDSVITFTKTYGVKTNALKLESVQSFAIKNTGSFAITSNNQELIALLQNLASTLNTFTTGLNPGTLVAQAAIATTQLAALQVNLSIFKGL